MTEVVLYPGIRSGKPTVEYLTQILNYIILIGAVGLLIVAVIPIVASGVTGAKVGFGRYINYHYRRCYS